MAARAAGLSVGGDGLLQRPRRILDSSSGTSCGLGLVGIGARDEGRRFDCSRVGWGIQWETWEGRCGGWKYYNLFHKCAAAIETRGFRS
jgi:hypothetical protein